VLLGCLRYILLFLLLTASAPQRGSAAQASDLAIDKAPTEAISVGHKTPDPADFEPGVPHAKLRSSERHWPATVQVPLLAQRPPCVRRVISRIHWVRRRVPRMRDDALDH
jgi:hypothetical protein